MAPTANNPSHNVSGCHHQGKPIRGNQPHPLKNTARHNVWRLSGGRNNFSNRPSACQNSEVSTMDVSAANHERSRHDQSARQRPSAAAASYSAPKVLELRVSTSFMKTPATPKTRQSKEAVSPSQSQDPLVSGCDNAEATRGASGCPMSPSPIKLVTESQRCGPIRTPSVASCDKA